MIHVPKIHKPKWNLYYAFETNLIEALKHYHPPQSIISTSGIDNPHLDLNYNWNTIAKAVSSCIVPCLEKMLTMIDVIREFGQIERLVPWLINSHLVHQSTFTKIVFSKYHLSAKSISWLVHEYDGSHCSMFLRWQEKVIHSSIFYFILFFLVCNLLLLGTLYL